jgi:hypothetical protein
MMTPSIKTSFNSDFLYFAYPSSEKSCHSNELASLMGWKKGGMGEGGQSRGRGLPFKSSPCWKRRQKQEEEEPKANYF